MNYVDFTSDDADLWFGSVGAWAGHTVVIVRTEVGEDFLKLAESAGYTDLKSGVNIAAIAKIGGKKKSISLKNAKTANRTRLSGESSARNKTE